MTDKTRKAATQAAVEAQAAAPKADADALTIRDQIAMRAPHPPAAWINAYMSKSGRDVIDAQALASWAYEYADAAMVERAK